MRKEVRKEEKVTIIDIQTILQSMVKTYQTMVRNLQDTVKALQDLVKVEDKATILKPSLVGIRKTHQ
jgi:hypothetical protein